MKNDMILDKEELELLNELEGESFVDIPLTKSEKENYTSYAKYTKSLQEKKQTTIRFSVSDLAIVKSKAKEIGIGYQNLIQALVHNYATGKIKLEV
jgi:predicted DNA binding CopG/RHH family protein